MRLRFTLKHQLAVEALQFTNNEFEVSISGWDQLNNGSEQGFVWNNPSSVIADASVSGYANTAAIGQQCPFEPETGWPPGTYTVAITATNTSTGGSSPFISQLNIYGSESGTSLDDAILFLGDDGEWEVGAGELTQQVIFTTSQHYDKIFFKFTKQGVNTGYEVIFTINTIELIRVNGATNDHEISEPDGWKGAKIILERDPQFCDLVEIYEGAAGGAFIFYGENGVEDGGINFIKDVEENYGFDANIEFLAELAPDDVNYETIFEGLLELSGKNEMKDNKMQVPVIRDDFWAKFINRMDTPVNLSDLFDLDGNPVDPCVPVTVTLTDQFINQYFIGFLPEATYSFNAGIVGNGYIQLDFDDTHELMYDAQKAITIDEIDDHISGYPIIDNPEQPNPSFEFEFPGDVVVNDLTIIARNLTNDTTTHLDADIKGYLFDGTTEHLLTRTDYLGSDGTTRRSRFEYSGTITDIKSITVYLYNDSGSTSGDIGLLFDDQVEIGVPGTYTTKFDFHLKSKYPSTTAQGYLIHDLIHGVLARLGLGDNPFYSDFLGSTFTNSRQYDADGCGSYFVVMKGLQIRQYTLSEKPFFISFKQIWDGINPILNLGLGYEVSEDSPDYQYIRIEQRDHFYDDTTSINFSDVREISSTYDQELIFKTIKSGYKKWQSENKSGIDDPQTKQTRATRFEKTGKDLTLESDFIATGLVFEQTRRTKENKKNDDYKYDNDNFILAINKTDVSPDFTPELDENFDSVTNLINPEARYNLILTPLRNFLRWANVIGGCLQSYATSSYKFVSGEGNYDMTSDYSCASGDICQAILCDSLTESDDISLATYNATFGYLHLALLYDITIPMEWEEYQTIRNNRQKAIGISQTSTGHIAFKIKRLEYDIVLGQANIKAWPKTFLSITVPEQDFTMYCEPPTPSIYVDELQAILDYAESLGFGIPSDEVLQLLDDLITELISLGVWQNLDLLYIFATDGDRDFAKINLVSPGNFSAVEVNTPDFITNIGFEGNGTNSYLNTTWAPDPDAVHFTQNECGIFCDVNNDIAASSNVAFGAVGNSGGSGLGRTQLIPKNATGHGFCININGSVVIRGTSVTSDGFFHIRRTSSSDQRIFKNGSQVGTTDTTASTTISEQEMYILAQSFLGTAQALSEYQISVFGIGSSFSGLEQEIFDAFNIYTTAVEAITYAFLLEDSSGIILLENGDTLIKET